MSKIKKILVGLVALFSTGAFYPCFWTSAIVGKASFIIFSMTLALWACVLLLCGRKCVGLSNEFNGLYLLLFFYYILRLALTVNEEYAINLAQLIVFYVYVFLAYNTYKDKKFLCKCYIRFHIMMIIFSIIGITLHNIGLLNGFRFISMSEHGGATLIDYGLFYAKSHTFDFFLEDMFIRPAGYYDEPGSLGFVSVLLLILNRKLTQNRKYELIIMFGTLISISMAYIYSLILFVLLFYVKFKNLKYVVGAFIIGMVIINSLSHKEGSFYEYFYEKTVKRNEKISSGTDASRNYSASFNAFYDNMLLGATTEELDKKYNDATHETIWFFMAQNGIIGTMILFTPFFFIAIRNKEMLDKKLLLLIALNLIQRPHYIAPLYLAILYFSFFLKRYNTQNELARL